MSLKLTLKNVIQPFICDRCGRDFTSRLLLKHHKSRIHNPRKPYVCRSCLKAFRRISELQQHSRKHRYDDTPYKCEVCDEVFKSKSMFLGHMGQHVHFEGHHECGYCSASFQTLAEAKLHVLLVHKDSTVLPQERPRRSSSDFYLDNSVEDVFCVQEGGEGLKLRLKRKLSTDGNYEQTADDLNPGSHASDSGKGNSDMDDEDNILRNGNQLLKMPTLVVRQNDHTITTTQHKPVYESSLLMKPKLELEQTLWGASKIQPRLDSSDFLSKTNFASSLNSKLPGTAGSKLTPPTATFGSPSHPGSFSSGLLNGAPSFSSTDIKPSLLQPPHASSLLSNISTGFFTSKTGPLSAPASNLSFGSKPVGSAFASNGRSAFASNGLNGSVFKTPHIFPKNVNVTKFGQSPGFGSGASKPGLFGSTPSFGSGFKPNSLGFGSLSKFGMSSPLRRMDPKLVRATLAVPTHMRNGGVSHEPVFGSREKIRRMLATKEEKKQSSAFEQYAGSASEQTTSNPFADAMRKAKNPSPRRRVDSGLFDETSSSYYTESEAGDGENSDVSGDLSGFTDEEISTSEAMNVNTEPTEIMKPPVTAVLPSLPTLPEEENSVPAAVAGTPQQPWTSPAKVSKFPQEPLPISSPQPFKSKVVEEAESAPAPMARTRRGSRRLSAANKTPSYTSSTVSVHQRNGDIGAIPKPLNEVSGHIDLEAPSLTLSIPLMLVEGARTSTKAKTRKPSGRSKRSLRTPNPYATTPAYPPATPAYPGHTPVHPSATPSYQPPQTPSYFGSSSPSHPPATPAFELPPTPMEILPPPTPVHRPMEATLHIPVTPVHMPPETPVHMPPATPVHQPPQTPVHLPPPTPVHLPPQTPVHMPPTTPVRLPPTPVHVSRTAGSISTTHNIHNKYNPKLYVPTKQEMMERMRKKAKATVRKTKRVRIGPKSFLRRIGRKVAPDVTDELPRDPNLFYKSELMSTYSGRTDAAAPLRAGFKQNQLYLCYLRKRALDLVISVFPNIRCGGNFSANSDDVDGLLDYIITCLENQDTSSRCMRSMSSTRQDLEVVITPSTRASIRRLQRKLCKLLKLMLPSLSLEAIEKEGIKTLPKLIHKVILENRS